MATADRGTAARPARRPRDGYAVELPGRLSPSVLCSLTRDSSPGAGVHSLVESVFVLPDSPAADLPEVAAALHDHGLVVLGIRRISPDPQRAPRRTPPPEAHPTGEDQP